MAMTGTQEMAQLPPRTDEEQADLLSLLEASMSAELLDAVERAYHAEDDQIDEPVVDISYEGTVYAGIG
jgi:hypothetical protein